MFDPRIGVILPSHFTTQQRIKDGMNFLRNNNENTRLNSTSFE